MTLKDVCNNLNCEYEELVSAIIETLEITGYAVYTMEIIDEMDKLYEE